MAIRTLSLCSGYEGIGLGLKLALGDAVRTVCYVEREAYCASLIVQRIKEEILSDAPIWSDLKTFDAKPWRGKVDLITGGYPCQPFSVAGKRAGTEDPRHLWPFIKEHIREIQPAACFFENVAGHLSLGFDLVKADLEDMGYEVAAGLFTAEEVGASHKRERLFILAYRADQRLPLSGYDGLRKLLEEGTGGADNRPQQQGGELAHDKGLGRGEELGGTQGEPGHPAFKGEIVAHPAGVNDNERPEHAGHGRSGSPEQAGVGGRELADSPSGGRDWRSTTSGDDGERDKGGDQPGGQGEGLADSDHDGLGAGRGKEEPGRVSGDGHAAPEGGEGMAHGHDQGSSVTRLPRISDSEEGGWTCPAPERNCLPLFAPGPEELELWGRILQDYPELEPAVRGVADGTPFRVDRIRALGNGVVPDVAALAFVILLWALAQGTKEVV